MGSKILIVDDEYFITRSLSYLFSKESFDTRVARNGPEALSLVAEQCPDLVFLDVDMPGMSGYEVAREIRRKHSSEEVYIIMLTAKGQEADRVLSLESGADEYMPKPFDPKGLLRRVHQVCNSRTP